MSEKHMDEAVTHFGFESVAETEKAGRVRSVFDSVADRYDIMNDVMSAGVHRLWKDSLIHSLKPRGFERMLDVAGGTGDIAQRATTDAPGLQVTVCDINKEMLRVGRQRAIDTGFNDLSFVCGDAEHLPFEDMSFDALTIAFGIRNVTRIQNALGEFHRVLKPGGRFYCLEFSPDVLPILKGLYDQYSFSLIPKMGGWITGDSASYQYLVESIRRFPTMIGFEDMIKKAGFKHTGFRSMSAGVVAVHHGWRV